MRRHIALLAAAAICASLVALGDDPRLRPESWASPVLSERLGNWYKLDESVFRSAQPDKDAFADIEKMGIRSVLNLRELHSDDDEAKGRPQKLYRVPMEAGSITREQVVAALRILKDCEKPVLVHCWHGSDRTGTVCAMYRIVFQGWSKEAAIDELRNGGYGFHENFKNIPKLIQDVDAGQIRREVMDAAPPP